MRRPFTQEELVELDSMGYDVSTYKGEPAEFPDPPPSSSLAVGARAAGASALPTAAGGAGFALGMKGGAALGALGGPAAPVTVPVGALIGGLGGGYLASKAAAKAQGAMMPQTWQDQLAKDAITNPVASTVGGIATMPLGGFNLSPSNLAKAGGAAGRLALGLERLGNLEGRQALVNVGAGTALGGIQEAVMAPLEGREITAENVGLNALLGAAFNKPNAIGRRYGFHDATTRVTEDPQLLTRAGTAKPRKPVAEVKLPEGFKPENAALLPPVKEPAKQTDIMELINSKVIEANKPKPETPASGLKAEVQAGLKGKGLTGDLTRQYADAVTKEILNERGITVAIDGTLMGDDGNPINGRAFIDGKTRKILFNPVEGKTGLDTLPHEGVHHMRFDLEHAAAKGDKKATELLAKWDELSKPEMDKLNAERVAKGLKPYPDAHEFAVSQQGYEFVKQQLNLAKEGGWKRWWNDTKALFNTKYNTGKVSLEDLRRAINFKFVHERVKASAVPGSGSREQPDEEFLHPGVEKYIDNTSQQGRDERAAVIKEVQDELLKNGANMTRGEVASLLRTQEGRDLIGEHVGDSLQIAEYSDRLAKADAKVSKSIAMLKQNLSEPSRNQPSNESLAPEGYRRVNVRREDGTTYEAFFNDKYYDGFPGRPASISFMSDGSLTHGATKKGETIEELGGREQPQGESLNRNLSEEKKLANQKDRERRKEENEAIRGEKEPRSAGIPPLTYPRDPEQVASILETEKRRIPVTDILNLETRAGLADFNEYVKRAVHTAANRLRAEGAAGKGPELPASYSKETGSGIGRQDYDEIAAIVAADVKANGVDRINSRRIERKPTPDDPRKYTVERYEDTTQGPGAMMLRRTLYRRARDAWKDAIKIRSAEKGTKSADKNVGEEGGATVLDVTPVTTDVQTRASVTPKVTADMSRHAAAREKIKALQEERAIALEEYGSETADAVVEIDNEIEMWEKRAGREQGEGESLRKIETEWDEGHPDDGGDGYWIQLKPGYTVDGISVIHERTKKEAYARLVEAKFGRAQPEGESLSEAELQKRALNPEWREDARAEKDDLYNREPVKENKFDKIRAAIDGREQGEGESLFDLKANKVLRAAKTNNSGAFNGDQILGVLRNQTSPVEYDMLKQAGLEELVKNRYINKDELLGWIREHGPKVEVHSYGMEGKVSEARGTRDRIEHELETSLNAQELAEIQSYVRTGNEEYLVGSDKVIVEKAKQLRAVKQELEKTEHLTETSPRATSAYDTVSAFPTSEKMPEWTVSKEGKNVQRVDVVLPNTLTKNAREEVGFSTKAGREQIPLWQPDNLHENLPNTLGWSMIQYKDGPKGERIAFIGEAQSRWGQTAREVKAKSKAGERQSMSDLAMTGMSDLSAIDHPLLKDYNRLILKAAIEQARKEGATHIVVSDAESAMMTEGHDLHVDRSNVYSVDDHTPKVGDYGLRYRNGQMQVYRTKENALQDLHRIEKNSSKEKLERMGLKLDQTTEQDMEKWGLKQEPGMRLNYDTILPKIMEELSGVKGEKVSLGEHKNAFTDRESNRGYEMSTAEGGQIKEPRQNLIFRNADGTPKTDVSGMMFPLEKVSQRLESGDKFTLFNKHQEAGESLAPAGRIAGKQGFLEAMSPTFDKLKGVDPEVGPVLSEAFKEFEVAKRGYIGLRNEALKALQKYDLEEVTRINEMRRDAFRNDNAEVLDLAGESKEIYDVLKKYYHDEIGITRNELGLLIEGRKAGKNPNYTSDMLNEETLDLFVNKPLSPEAKYAKNQWVDYLVKESEGKIDAKEARENINDYVDAIGGKNDNYLSVKFGAIRKAAGYGLPDSIREKNPLKALSRYGRRAASDLAMFQELESKPEISSALKLKNPNTGELVDHPNAELGLSADTRVRNAMKWVTDDFGNTMSKSQPHINAFVRLVHSSIMGLPTGLRDLASVPVNMLPYINSMGDLGAALKGIVSFREHSADALRSGARQPNIDLVQFKHVLDAPDRVTAIMHKVATGMRKWQGRELLENVSRDITFGAGKEMAYANIEGVKNGNKRSQQFIEKFSTGVDGDVTTMEGAALEKAVNTIAANFTERNQGTYGGRGLPVGIVESQFAPFFSLQKWGIEKSNVIWQDVFKPALTGDNYLPLLTYSLGSVLTGAAIQELNKALTGRKPQDPDIKEALAKGDAKAYAAELATLMQLGSFAGIAGDILKAGIDASLRGKTSRSIVSFPAFTSVVNTGEKVTDAAEALRQGENPWDVIKMFSVDFMSDNIQNLRALLNHTVKNEDLERSDKFRDRRIYNELEGKPAGDIPKPNKYLGIQERRFKQADTAQEVRELLPKVLANAKAKAGKDPEKLRRAIVSLKGNSYQTMPSPTDSPFEFRAYYDYLVRTQGKTEADKRVRDYLTQRMLNHQKSRMLPSLR